MTFAYANMRGSAVNGSIVDAAGDNYNIGSDITAQPIGIWSGIWSENRTSPTSAENTNSTGDAHIAGVVTATSSTHQYIISGLTPNHTYNLKLYLGKYNPGTNIPVGWACVNTDGSLAHAGANATIPSGEAKDAPMSATFASPAALVAASGGTAVSITPTGSTLKFGKNTNNMYLMAIGIEDPTAATATSTPLMMMGV